MQAIGEHDASLQRVAELMRASRAVLAISGAGISADSGLPTYRGIGGLYNTDVTEEGMTIETLLSGATMRRAPELTWKYLLQIEQACRGATFNRGHEVLAQMESHFERMCVLTQNVDGFHRQAGSKNVIDIHGDLHNLKCTRCRYRQTVEDYSNLELPPRCPDCRGILRPDVVLFGEMLPQDKMTNLFIELDIGFDLVFSVGTTSVFPYIAEPVYSASARGAATVEINPGTSDVTDVVDIRLPLRAAEALDEIWRRYQRLEA